VRLCVWLRQRSAGWLILSIAVTATVRETTFGRAITYLAMSCHVLTLTCLPFACALSHACARTRPFRAVTVCDINAAMLEQGEARAHSTRNDPPGRLAWVQGSAEELPFPDESFDAYTISFGIRNVTHLDKALKEAHRVLVRGGRFMCLEFSRVPNPLLRAAYDAYSFQVIPVLGEVRVVLCCVVAREGGDRHATHGAVLTCVLHLFYLMF
jgi:ubiquinone/menaquinone biosynthesis methyltransferase